MTSRRVTDGTRAIAMWIAQPGMQRAVFVGSITSTERPA